MSELGPETLRRIKDRDLYEDAVNWPGECDAHAAAWEADIAQRERDWLALLQEISKLDREPTDWEGADDSTFLEEFDPWDVLRTEAARIEALERALRESEAERERLAADLMISYESATRGSSMNETLEGLRKAIEQADAETKEYGASNPDYGNVDVDVCRAVLSAWEDDRRHIAILKSVTQAQAMDESIWSSAQTAMEAYLQRSLRYLHALIEGHPYDGPR